MAFAASDAHAGARTGWQPLSVEWAYYHALKRDGGKPHSGTTIDSMLEALRFDGQPDEAAWPYVNHLFTDTTGWVPPKAHPLFRRGNNPQTASVQTIKDRLDADDPVLFTMSVSASFFRPSSDGIIDATEPLEPNRVHALIAVGHGRRRMKLFILARNSWGTAWGLDGYAWISASYIEPRLLRAATMAGEL